MNFFILLKKKIKKKFEITEVKIWESQSWMCVDEDEHKNESPLTLVSNLKLITASYPLFWPLWFLLWVHTLSPKSRTVRKTESTKIIPKLKISNHEILQLGYVWVLLWMPQLLRFEMKLMIYNILKIYKVTKQLKTIYL